MRDAATPAERRGRATNGKKAGAKKARTKKTSAKKTDAEKAGAKKAGAKEAGAKKTGAKKTSAKKTAARKTGAKKTSAKKTAARKAGAKKTSAKKTSARKTSAKKTSARKTSAKKTSAKKTAAKKTSAKKTAAKKTAAKKTSAKKTAAKKTADRPVASEAEFRDQDSGGLLPPVTSRRKRDERDRASVQARLREIDTVMTAWADLIAQRMVADQAFSDIVEAMEMERPRNLHGLFQWEALHAAEARVALFTEVIDRHLEDRRADPVAILAELRSRQEQLAAVYAVNAFLAVLNQMKPSAPKWVEMDEIDPRFAVLAMAHQTLTAAAENVQAEGPTDLTDLIIAATQDDAVWVWRRMPEPGTDTLAACAASAAFFRLLEADVLLTTDEVAAHYAAHGRAG